MAYGYCFGCGNRVSTHDLDAGIGKRFPQGLCCQPCLRGFEEALLLAGAPESKPSHQTDEERSE